MVLNPPKLPISSIVGLVIIVFFCSFLTLSIISFPPGFSPLKNWMSDLGNPELNPAGYTYFNLACMITGLLLIVFYLELNHSHGTGGAKLLTAARAFGIFSGLALAGVGYFNETFSPHHFIVSALFFLSSTIAILLATVALRGRQDFGRVTAGAGFLAVAVGVVFSVQMVLFESVTIVEWVSVLSMLLWAALFGADTYRASRRRHGKTV